METGHKIFAIDASDTKKYIEDKSVALVVTSPPYPMVEMWDECLSAQSDKVKTALQEKRFESAFEEMHKVLDKVWEDVDRTLMDGGVACINIGDATRNCDGQFKLFSNHARIIKKFLSMGYDVLPDIHWHKPTNAPNKFMGSGMYPPCAYVTYEHEYILIFRKGANRKFTEKEKRVRHKSAYFWEERNVWFSDLWELNGMVQKLTNQGSRERSAAFPFELAYRLINMYSLQGDTVYDPFCGTGTVAKAAAASQRNSVGADIDAALCEQAKKELLNMVAKLNNYQEARIKKHTEFVAAQSEEKKQKMYQNKNHGFLVKTRQETEILLPVIREITQEKNSVKVTYKN